ncbi:16S rRNA (cytosine(967)-C(5))-methyltransferase RsmB [Pusillimonas sp. NJUB218]|uniref:16S rRNA (cytosine(967)-C(5))-methyltransferase RsmB n=1 Tax=Pusillimonas sp. NJUB218 TaxID=2023230 RepID=UPI000F4BCD63|nr:16S rRNA (cytosine(967)-C(5))-methyltransferase RsmB [Pusillimonas sp. NJUB218]ROT44909.1 16S rRNA (cytosine(967)-C(5))-methyltransferase [Pusillimonas sp. NJUB218]
MTDATTPSRHALSDIILASAQCLTAVHEGRSLSDVLAQTPPTLKGATQAVSFHVMRHLGQALEVKHMLVAKTPPVPLLDAVLQVSLCLLDTAMVAEQLTREGKPVRPDWPVYAVHTVVDQAVSAVAGHRRMQSFKALVNGVLRRFTREREAILTRARGNPEARWNHPNWWVRRLRQAYPDHWKAVLSAAQLPPPMTLRVNTRKRTVTQFLADLGAAGINAHAVQLEGIAQGADAAVVLEHPRPVQDIPGFAQGWWSVQDAAAQLAAPLLGVQSGMRVLDACAAPGGKTAHLLELADLDLVALDADASRLARVGQNLERLGLASSHVKLTAADASRLDTWWDGQPFDAILADVPCTASGVVRRHPDILWLRREADIARTAALQRKIVKALWKTLKPGGRFLYVTCSVFPQEGESQAQWILEQYPDAVRLDAPGQLLPLPVDGQAAAHDGFFFALFAKQAAVDNNNAS